MPRWKNIQKCYPFEEKRLLKWRPPYLVQPKYDGDRCRAVPIPGNKYLLLSSEENIIYSVPHINEALDKLNLSYQLDGELYCHRMPHSQIHGIVSRTINLHPDHTLIRFHCFDLINDLPQMNRIVEIDKLKNLSPYLTIAPFWLCNTLSEIMKIYDHLISAGYEGIIVRDIFSHYVPKRSTQIMKFKPKKSDSYKITGFTEEISIKGTPKNSLGALTCESGDGNFFNVGSGFTSAQRHDLWQIRNSLIDKYCKISYQHLTSGRKVPRFPVFVTIEQEGE